MPRIRTVSLEFLRHGPAYNQLLSPLTNYLGLCGDYGAATVNVPYEHQEFLASLETLRYGGGSGRDEQRRHLELGKTAEDMTEILASVPGLLSALGNTTRDNRTITHLRLVLSASELAMLPFELTKVPSGCVGGEGNWLLLQTLAPVCMTRQVRGVASHNIHWPRHAKILFIAAGPRGMDVPARSHIQVLVQAIQPWLKYFDPQDKIQRNKTLGEVVTILNNATLKDIEETCAEQAFTHVHILAHGMEDKQKPGSPFGIALHGSGDTDIDVVSGERLASALRPLRCDDPQADTQTAGLESLPTVVTVASCDSGNVGSVVHNNGASFAHALHQAGIPLVVGSQFPLSKKASVHMAQLLYEGLLWGEDPRLTLQQLRSRLHALSADTHDWASLVAYAALPDDLDDQLIDVKYHRAKAAINAAMDHIDKTIDRMNTGPKGQQTVNPIPQLLSRLDHATSQMPTTGAYTTEGKGLLGSTEKRKAEALFRVSQTVADKAAVENYWRQSLKALEQSMDKYQDAYRENMRDSAGVAYKRASLHWVMCQYLSLRAVLGEPFLRDHWSAAIVSAQVELTVESAETVIWAHGSLAELYLLLLAHARRGLPMSHAQAEKRVLEHAGKLLSLSGHDSFPVYSTKRQFTRYAKWWGHKDFEPALEKASAQARETSWDKRLIDVALEVVELLTKG